MKFLVKEVGTEMNEIIIINGYEYTKNEFDTIAAFVGSDIN